MELSSILLIIVILGLAVGAVWIIYLRGRTEELPNHNIMVICHLQQFSGNSKMGWFVKRIRGKDRSIVIFQPIDIDYNKPQLVKNQRVVVKNSILETFASAKGIESNEIGYMYLYPHKSELFSINDQKVLGKEFLKKIDEINEIDNRVELMNNKEKVQKSILMKTEGWDLFNDYIKKKKLLDKDIIQDIKNLRDDKKPFTNAGTTPGGF